VTKPALPPDGGLLIEINGKRLARKIHTLMYFLGARRFFSGTLKALPDVLRRRVR
jgi:hypothetical protein